MKKLSFVLLTLLITSGAFAGDGAIPAFRGMDNFIRTFPDASGVTCKIAGNLTEVNFTWINLKLVAFYDREGELVATTRAITFRDLPLSLQMNIMKGYAGFEPFETIEFNDAKEGLCYYVTIANASKTYVLHVSTDGTNYVFKKMKN